MTDWQSVVRSRSLEIGPDIGNTPDHRIYESIHYNADLPYRQCMSDLFLPVMQWLLLAAASGARLVFIHMQFICYVLHCIVLFIALLLVGLKLENYHFSNGQFWKDFHLV